jgi:hypothetical protein
MPEIIDIITPKLSDCYRFTASNLADYVVTTLVLNPKLYNSVGNYKFKAGDSFRLLSCGVTFPESFTLWKDPALIDKALIQLKLVIKGLVGGNVFYNPNFSSGEIYLPSENFELVTDSFMNTKDAYDTVVPTTTLNDEAYELYGEFANLLNISMMGLPAAMDGKTFRIVPFFKLKHSFPMYT